MPLSHLPVDALDRIIEVSSTACVKVMSMAPEHRMCRIIESARTYEEIGILSAFLTKAASDAKRRRQRRG